MTCNETVFVNENWILYMKVICNLVFNPGPTASTSAERQLDAWNFYEIVTDIEEFEKKLGIVYIHRRQFCICSTYAPLMFSVFRSPWTWNVGVLGILGCPWMYAPCMLRVCSAYFDINGKIQNFGICRRQLTYAPCKLSILRRQLHRNSA